MALQIAYRGIKELFYVVQEINILNEEKWRV
jgi:hypothetical protein